MPPVKGKGNPGGNESAIAERKAREQAVAAAEAARLERERVAREQAAAAAEAARLERERVAREQAAAAAEAARLERERLAKEKADAEAAVEAALQERIRKAVQEALEQERRGGGGSSGSSEAPPGPTRSAVPPPAAPAPAFSVHASLMQVPYSALRFEGVLGEGGFGTVYKGVWEHAPVAIKQLKLSRLTGEAQKSFEQETQVMFGLRHPHITQLLAVCVEPGRICMVMEYVPKGSLFFVLHDDKEPLGWTMKYKIATQVAGALSVLHSKGIVHRDLKSHNVLLDEAYNAKLSDFGLAKVKTETASTSTMAGIQGTVAWMAPECFTLRPKITNKTDIHSFGILLWELLTRQSPFEGVAQAILITHLAAGATEIIPEDAPTGLTELIKACWRREPVERPEATAVFETLSRLSLAAEAEEAAAPKEPGPKTVAIDALRFRVAHLEAGAAGKDSLIPSDAAHEPYEPG